jgi:hypothetical protein
MLNELNTSSATEDILHILWILRIHYCVHKSLLLAPILIHMNPLDTILSYFFKIHVYIYA